MAKTNTTVEPMNEADQTKRRVRGHMNEVRSCGRSVRSLEFLNGRRGSRDQSRSEIRVDFAQ